MFRGRTAWLGPLIFALWSLFVAGCGGDDTNITPGAGAGGSADAAADHKGTGGGGAGGSGGTAGTAGTGGSGGSNVNPDAMADVKADAAPDQAADVTSDVSSDNVTSDRGPDVTPDTTSDVSSDRQPDVTSDGGTNDGATSDGATNDGAGQTHTVGGTLSGLAASATVTLQNNGGNNLVLSANGSFTFTTALASGTTYAVTVSTQPAGQTCTVTNGTGTIGSANVTNVAVQCTNKTYTVGGTVSGLTSTGLILNNGGDSVTVNANGSFTFPTALTNGSTYNVTVGTQPAGQACTVSGGSGTISGANVSTVVVNCANNLFTVGGTLSGLATGAQVVLQNNGGNNLTLTSNGTFSFSQPVATGANYAVTVLTQPTGPSQTCVVTSGSGTMGSANVTSVNVTCTTNSFTVGGSVAGLANGDQVVLLNNGGNSTTLSANGTFTFSNAVDSGQAYNVTVQSSPTSPVSQTCVASQNTGTIGGANVTNVVITCTTNSFKVGGTVVGLTGGGANSVVLHNNGGDAVTVSADGSFTFPTSIASGSTYAATVAAQPTNPPQTCVVTSGSGTVGNNDVNSILVNCSNDYSIGGTVSGLAGGTVILNNNGGDSVSVGANGNFTFPTPLVAGSTYLVTVGTQPSGPTQTCIVTNGSGTANANVTNVTVNCTTNSYKVGGTISGLTNGESFTVQNNGGPDLIISANGNFVFPASVNSGQPYSVTVHTNPVGPPVWETCTVTNGTGTIGASDIQNVDIDCAANPHTIGGTLSGLGSGDTVVLQDNGGNNLSVSADGSFVFTQTVASGATYTVSVFQNPTAPIAQTCTATANTGTIADSDITTVTVNCTTNSYSVGGTLTGMDTSSGNTITLQDNAGPDLVLSANGSFTFATLVSSGANYAVTVHVQPPNPAQTCNVVSGSGTIGASNVANVIVNCNTNAYAIGGTVTGLGAGDTVVLKNVSNGETLSVSTASFAFPTFVSSGQPYDVEVLTDPTAPISQHCVASSNTGTVTNTDINTVAITCTTNKFTIGGTITGLADAGTVVLTNNGADDLLVNANGQFTFATAINSGTTFDVEVKTNPDPVAVPSSPTQQVCTATTNTGTVGNANVTTVTVDCVTTQYTVSVQLNGLATATPVSIDLQNNGGNDIVRTSNGTQAFTVQVNNNSPYNVTILTQPSNTLLQSQICNVVMGSGTMPTHDITVQAYCGRTCASIHAANPAAGDGLYLIDPDGVGPIAQFNAYCVMLFDGGGWTLAESTSGGQGPQACSAGVVTQNSCTFMPTNTVKALANLSTQVHVRDPVSPGSDPIDYTTSLAGANTAVIQNLRAGAILNSPPLVPNGDIAFQRSLWPTMSPADNNSAANRPWGPGMLDTTCSVQGQTWPSVYHACNNFLGWHLDSADLASRWRFSSSNISLETYVR